MTSKYPVVDPEPTLTKAIFNFNFKDVTAIALFSASGYVFGWVGARKPLRPYNSKFTAGIGLLAGLSYAVLGSSQRLLGLEPNESEVRRFGLLTPEQVKIRNDKLSHANLNLIDSNYDKSDPST